METKYNLSLICGICEISEKIRPAELANTADYIRFAHIETLQA